MTDLLEIVSYLLGGLLVTVELTLCGAAVAVACAFAAGLALLSRDVILRALARAYVEVFRGTSALVQLFWFYFALPALLDVRLSAFTAGVAVLGLNIGAYGAEVVRGAIQAVPGSQREAACALGLSRRQTLRHILLPQAFLGMLPPFGNLLIELLKSTALVSMITVSDLTRAGKVLQEGEYLHRSAEVFGLLLAIYFALSLVITYGVRRLEGRYARKLGLEGRR